MVITDDPLYGIGGCCAAGRPPLPALLDKAGRPGRRDTDDEQVAPTWIATQELGYSPQPRLPRADQHLYRWLTYCTNAQIPELTRLAATIDSWRTELLPCLDTGGVSNGPTEAINLLIKKIKRIERGFRNFDNYRLRLLLRYGIDWNTIRATPIRGRLPRLTA